METKTEINKEVDSNSNKFVSPPKNFPITNDIEWTEQSNSNTRMNDRSNNLKNGNKIEILPPSFPVPPDGGWGWMVVFSSLIVHMIADGISYTFGEFLSPLVETFDTTRSQASLVQSLMIGLTLGCGPLASVLTNRFGCRLVTIIGSIIAALGFFIGAFANNLITLFFSIGILGGMGLSLIYLPSIVSVTYYFEKKRSFATGIAVCGSGIGTFVMSPILQILKQKYGWRGALIIESGILLNCCICGSLFRPLKDNDKVIKNRKDALYSRSLNNLSMYKSDRDSYMASMTDIDSSTDVNGKKCKINFDHILDLKLFLDPLFILFAVSNFLTSLGFYVPFAYLKDRAVNAGNHSESQASMLISIIGITNMIGRLVFGFLSDRKFINRLHLYNTSLTLCGFVMLISTVSNSYGYLAFVAASFGLLIGVYVSLTSVVLVDLLGIEKLSNSFGILLLFQGTATIIGPPLAGALYDNTKSYNQTFWFAGGMIGISGVMLFVIPCLKNYLLRKENEKIQNHQISLDEL